jgi:hypothetical protein
MSGFAAAGWHQDPSDPARLRWWDGAQWTEHTQPMPPTGPASSGTQPGWGVPGSGATPPFYGGPADASGHPGYGQQGYGQPGYGGPSGYQGQTPYGGHPGAPGRPAYGNQQPGGYGRRRGRFNIGPIQPGSGFRQRNSLSIGAIAVSVIYIAVASLVHIVLLGIVPLLYSVRAVQRKEALAPVAVAAAILTLVLSVAALHGRV